MARKIYRGYARDGNGTILSSATVYVYLTGTSTAASVYTASSGGTAVNSVTTDSTGLYSFYTDYSDYTAGTLFRLTISKTGYDNVTYDEVDCLPPTFSTDGTCADNSDSEFMSEKAVKTYVDTTAAGIVVGVNQWGATGDGVTDDAAAIQAAVNYAKANGLSVYLPAGTYAIGTEIKLDECHDMMFSGAGKATIIKPTSGTSNITGVWLYKCEDCVVRDLTIQDFVDDGGGTDYEVMGVHVEGGWRNTVTGCRITGCDNSGIRLGYDRTAYNAMSVAQKRDPVSAASIAIDGGRHHCHNNHISGTVEGHGIENIRSNANLIHHNTISDITYADGYGIRCVGGFDVVIDHNWLYDTTNIGIVVSAAGFADGGINYISKTSRRCIVNGNFIRCESTMENPAHGIYFTLGADQITVTNNHINLPSTTGVYGISCIAGVSAYTTTWDYDFKECQVSGNIVNGAMTAMIVSGEGNGLTISGNTLNSFQLNGIYLAAPPSATITGAYVDGNTLIPSAGSGGTRYGIYLSNSTGGHTYAVIGRNRHNIVGIDDTYRAIACIVGTAAATDCQFHPLNVADFGAIGDGATDDSGAINYAIYVVNTCPIGELVFPNKTYVTTAGTTAITNASCRVTGYPPSTIRGGVARPDLGGTTSAADSLAIPITHCYVAKTTGADAEALTLANGKPGQILTICLVVDGGGDGTLTPTTKSGFATIVFADAGDTASLMYTNDTTGWVIIGTAGVAAPPVITV